MIAIIDYDAGNIKSVEKAMQLLGQEVIITRDRETIMNADKVILPGVGAFGDAMSKLRQYGLDEVIRDVTAKGTPFLGICLGLQLLFERSDETPGVEGLGILKGEILRIPDKEGLKIPHMGWNSLKFQNNGRLFKGIPEDSYVYFVHSYYLKAADEGIVTATTEYSTHIHASVEQGNVFACQFHPEKSSDIGILANRLKALHYRFVKSREQQECYRIASEVFFRVNAGILVVKGKERYLKSNEACLLKLLCRKMGTVVKIEELYAGIWGKTILFDSKDKALRNLVSELRKTLEGTGLEIRNKRFAGYYLKGE